MVHVCTLQVKASFTPSGQEAADTHALPSLQFKALLGGYGPFEGAAGLQHTDSTVGATLRPSSRSWRDALVSSSTFMSSLNKADNEVCFGGNTRSGMPCTETVADTDTIGAA